LKTILVLTGVPVLAGGSAVAAYHFNEDFRQLVASNIEPELINVSKVQTRSRICSMGLGVENSFSSIRVAWQSSR
jgi:hypothetical protein